MEEVEHQLLLRPRFHALRTKNGRLKDDGRSAQRVLSNPFLCEALGRNTYCRTVGDTVLFDHHCVDHAVILFLCNCGLKQRKRKLLVLCTQDRLHKSFWKTFWDNNFLHVLFGSFIPSCSPNPGGL